ncbi:NADP-dependent oxidoreductase [Pandoraea nosoerga]|uniref:2-alkenal reductase n=1 Tax=Pandoraea nosoerga TaxID=2508296 RepID=A0A5E4SHW3_9BURK|nr:MULTISPECIES: NADP-dependent oxidoreductase [Pandoraea]MBN4665362.1 NADP-dependent oxidoreductase [Pandoraea nosoerga]MBN4674762.1 NADP-dependent oxidoreductase [Pandoraea nosoerga]MBN4680652.1 NADP-dependent oxidoreductase [Pandoraea nosoerga]MBN4744056.1 NADP-dependent oxidoreductase [Pandoraea nosoerga]VVD73818.1 2-alkenal reductase [Pandoraea nosoerga]
MTINRQILLVSRPKGEPTLENFHLAAPELPELGEGQVLVRNFYLSLDPYMRGRMNDTKSYAPPQPLDTVMIGATAGEVIESRHPDWQPGDAVTAMFGWQEYGISDGSNLRRIDVARVPMSAYLGAAGMPGVTAWYGLKRIIAPKAGETVAVSAASGAVGSVVGQLAKRAGCRVVGIAGGEHKCAYVVETLGFDACIDYKAGHLDEALRDAAPDGIDGYFENVGGAVLDAVLMHLNAHSRIALCGMIAGYNGDPIALKHPALLLTNRVRLEGFIVTEHMDVWPQALTELADAIAAGELRYRETMAQGIENAPAAFLGLLRGENFGKQIVRLV